MDTVRKGRKKEEAGKGRETVSKSIKRGKSSCSFHSLEKRGELCT